MQLEMAPNFSLFLGAFLLFLLVIQPLAAPYSNGSNSKPTGHSFQFLQHMEGCHKGQTVKGTHELKSYLQRFGYLHYSDSNNTNLSHASDDLFDDLLESAVKTYQENYRLKVTGNLDNDTITDMMLPRCGNPDIITAGGTKRDHRYRKFHMVSHYQFFDETRPRWPATKTRLTYSFRSTAQVVGLQVLRSVCERAFKRWADVTHFTFQEAPQAARGDIEIGFHRRFHGDSDPFDGRGSTLAHASRPTSGQFHYDGDENWSTNPRSTNEVDLESVAVHEIGHVLGLGHSLDPDAIMYKSFSYGAVKRDLRPDDIAGIRALYS